MRNIIITMALLVTTQAFSMDLERAQADCPNEISELSTQAKRISEVEGPLSNIFFAAMRGYVLEASSCSDISLGTKKIKSALDSL